MFDRKLVCVTGLPRAGSTLLCQLLAHHPAIHCSGQSSPLPQFLASLRERAADSEFMLAQLDHDPEGAHERLMNAYRGFVAGWFAEADEPVVVDKNRAWLNQLELALKISPACRMLVCVRDLGQIVGSVEASHQKTLALDFADHTAALAPYDRANHLFARGGIVGLPLNAFRNAQDLPPDRQSRILCVVFEQLVRDPNAVLDGIWKFLELDPVAVDTNRLEPLPTESDSHYRLKYTHSTSSTIKPPRRHNIPQRIEAELRNTFDWYYKIFYPG